MNALGRFLGAAAAAALFGLLLAGCAAGGAAAPPGSVPACTSFGVRAIEQHRTVTRVPAACQGLSRAQVNFALGRAIYLVAASGHHKVVWRRDAALAGTRLARLIMALAQPSPGSVAASGAGGGRSGPVDRRPLGLATLAAWLLTVGIGGYMLGRFVASGGLRRQRAAGDRVGPAVVLSHLGLAVTGLLVWAVYLGTSWLPLAWLGVGLLLPVVGFGMATLIAWTSRASRTSRAASGTTLVNGPSPPGAPSPDGTPGGVLVAAVRSQAPADQATAMAAAAARRRPSRWLTVVLPIGHGVVAMATILLALLTALGAG
jgi:manganese efflux pump family protein